VNTGAVDQVSPDTISVVQFDWAPAESALAVSARTTTAGHAIRQGDLAIVDRVSRTMRPLVHRPGMDTNPSWSPDGKWIAFATQHGEESAYGGGPALISAAGGTPIRLASDEEPQMGLASPAVWTPDSRGFYSATTHHMTTELLFVNTAAKRVSLVAAEDSDTDSEFSFSADRRRVAFLRQSFVKVPEVYVQDLPNGEPRQITSLGASFPLNNLVRIDRVSWPSRDRKFTVHGFLLTPRLAGQQDGPRVQRPLPLLVFNPGGPAMVSSTFDRDGYNGGLLPLAARGYAILVPNTRGRNGYGLAFLRGMRDGQSNVSLPFEDMMGGIDKLVADGIADPDRLGIYGHSYGAYLASFALTQTDRFKAAALHEATRVDTLAGALNVPGSYGALGARDFHGVENPFDPATHMKLMDESTRLHMDRLSTPTLLQFGAHGSADRAGIFWFAALLHLKIPVEYVLYDSGHGVGRPSQMCDEITRLGTWFDYWLRGMPYPDKEKDKQFSAWGEAGR
jgi:dipeptidyl aminopeptidase/acylaminoacyl peptidase